MGRLSGKSLVVFDSSAETVMMLEAWFETLGARAHGASVPSATEVRAIVRDRQPDVVIFDVSVPYHEDVQMLHELQQSGAFGNAPLVVTTTNARVVAALARGMNLTIRHLVEKPYDMEILMERVHTALTQATAAHTAPERPATRIATRSLSDETMVSRDAIRDEGATECRGAETDCFVASALRREFQMRRDRWMRADLRCPA